MKNEKRLSHKRRNNTQQRLSFEPLERREMMDAALAAILGTFNQGIDKFRTNADRMATAAWTGDLADIPLLNGQPGNTFGLGQDIRNQIFGGAITQDVREAAIEEFESHGFDVDYFDSTPNAAGNLLEVHRAIDAHNIALPKLAIGGAEGFDYLNLGKGALSGSLNGQITNLTGTFRFIVDSAGFHIGAESQLAATLSATGKLTGAYDIGALHSVTASGDATLSGTLSLKFKDTNGDKELSLAEVMRNASVIGQFRGQEQFVSAFHAQIPDLTDINWNGTFNAQFRDKKPRLTETVTPPDYQKVADAAKVGILADLRNLDWFGKLESYFDKRIPIIGKSLNQLLHIDTNTGGILSLLGFTVLNKSQGAQAMSDLVHGKVVDLISAEKSGSIGLAKDTLYNQTLFDYSLIPGIVDARLDASLAASVSFVYKIHAGADTRGVYVGTDTRLGIGGDIIGQIDGIVSFVGFAVADAYGNLDLNTTIAVQPTDHDSDVSDGRLHIAEIRGPISDNLHSSVDVDLNGTVGGKLFGFTVAKKSFHIANIVNADIYGSSGQAVEARMYDLTPAAIDGATNLRAESVTAHQVNLRWNPGPGNQQYAVMVSTDSGGTWHVVGDPTAAGADRATVSVDPSKTYTFCVIALGNDNALKSNQVTVETPDGTVPVTGLRLVSNGSHEVEVRWNEAEGEDYYRVLVSTNGGASWSKQEDVPADHAYSAKLTVDPHKDYQFKVVAFNAYGPGKASDVLSVTTTGDPALAPTNLRVVSVAPTEVEVRWAEVSGEDHYQVQRSTDGGNSWTKQEDVPADHAYSAKLTVDPNKQYQFRVVSVNAYGTSDPSNVVSVKTPDGRTGAPSNLRVVSVAPTEVEVRWDEIGGEDHYQVERSTDSGNSWTKQEDVPADHAYSAKLTVDPNKQYQFRVVAVNSYGTSDPSNVVAVSTVVPPPSAPGNLRVVSVSPRSVEVRWDEVDGEDSYRVLVSTNGGASWSTQEDVPANHAYSAVLTVSPNRGYLFKVVAINGYGTSAASNVVSVTTTGEPTAARENLRLVTKRTNEVEVAWNEVSGEDHYTVQVSTDNGKTWKKQEDVPANHGYSAKLSVSNGKTYWFRVIAVNEFGNSVASNVLKVTT